MFTLKIRYIIIKIITITFMIINLNSCSYVAEIEKNVKFMEMVIKRPGGTFKPKPGFEFNNVKPSEVNIIKETDLLTFLKKVQDLKSKGEVENYMVRRHIKTNNHKDFNVLESVLKDLAYKYNSHTVIYVTLDNVRDYNLFYKYSKENKKDIYLEIKKGENYKFFEVYLFSDLIKNTELYKLN